MKNTIISKSNKLIEASYQLTLREQRVLLACIAQINSMPNANPVTPETRFEITAGGLADMTGIPQNQAYEVLKSAADKLYERSVVIDDPDPNEPWNRIKCHWIESISYRDDAGTIGLRFGVTVLPYLTQLSSRFTSYKLEFVAHMTSVYAIRIYELLVQWLSQGDREIELKKLKSLLQVDDQYPRIHDFKKRVIQPAFDQINEQSNLWLKVGYRKIGRSVTHVQFQFGLKDQKPKQKKLDLGELVQGVPKTILMKLARPGESYESSAKRIKKLKKSKESWSDFTLRW